MNKCLTTCRHCCKFRKERLYFAPKITDNEIDRIKSNGLYKPVFFPFKNSKKVFQISLTKSKKLKDIFVCPYLDENTHKCNIYRIRPFDCNFWPFIFMYDKSGKKVLIAHFNKEKCQATDLMSKIKYKDYLDKNLDKWINEKNIIELVKEYPELIWDYEPNTFIIQEINIVK